MKETRQNRGLRSRVVHMQLLHEERFWNIVIIGFMVSVVVWLAIRIRFNI